MQRFRDHWKLWAGLAAVVAASALGGAWPGVLVALAVAALLTSDHHRSLLAMRTAAEALAADRDASDRELATSLAAVRDDRGQLAAILASMAEGVVAVDAEERIVHVNAVAGRLLSVDSAKVLGRPIWEVTRLREIPAVLAAARQAAAPVHREVHRPGVPDRVLALRASPLVGGGGVPAGVVLVVEDVTQLRRLETMRSDFVANVSHELKTPLTAIRAVVETLCDDPDADPRTRRRFLDKIRVQSERMSSLVADLLSLARLESGGDETLLEPIDVRDAVRDSLRVLAPAAEARQLRFEVSLPPEPITVLGDDEPLRQAVTNLLDNAIKYSPQGETVVVRVGREEDRAVIEVIDHGIGIAPRHQERIFERFYRVDKARSRALGGTGLGLAIVKHIALALGGRVTVASRPGAGSAFRIELPALGAETAAETAPSLPAEPRAPARP